MAITTDSIVISRVSGVYVGAYGAAKAASTDVGSCEKASFSTEYDIAEATDAALADAVVAQLPTKPKGSFKMTLQRMTAYNLALAMGGTVSGAEVKIGTQSAITSRTLYIDGYDYEGAAGTLVIHKANLKPGTSFDIGGNEQAKLELEFSLMADSTQAAGEEFGKFMPTTADTTPPTVSTVTPADAATGVAKAASTTVTVQFSEAVRSTDVTDKTFFVHDDSGNVKAGAISTADNISWVFTPTTAWGATTKYHVVVCKGIRDTAGNALAAASVTDFTTGS
jgi:hypothetical protein